MALNLESGFFVAWMMWSSRKVQVPISLPLPRWMLHTVWFTLLYFLFAVLYDIVESIAKLIVEKFGGTLPF
jgi:hypothetical protein